MKTSKKITGIILILISVLIFGCSQSDRLAENISEEPVPTNTPIPGWTKYDADRFSLYLPDSYVGGNMKDDMDVIIERIESLGPEFSQTIDIIEQNQEYFLFYAVDSNVGPSGNFTNINVGIDKVLSTISIDMLFDATLEQFPMDYTVKNREFFEVNGYDAGSINISFTVQGINISEILYIVKDSKTVWIIACTTSASEIKERLPEFQKIINSIEIQPE